MVLMNRHRRVSRSLYAMAAVTVICAGAQLAALVVSDHLLMPLIVGGLTAALVLEWVLFRPKVTPRGFPVEPVATGSPAGGCDAARAQQMPPITKK